jgi:hypothetical protein
MGIPIETEIELEEKTIEPNPQLLKFEVNLDERSEVKVLNNKESFYNSIKKQLRLIFILQLD